MDPHFLFNSLNTLSALSQIDSAAVPKAAAHLGRFLRASLDQDERPFVSLKDELEVVDAYLEIEALRMGDRISVSREVDSSLMRAQLPPFLLQPLVENAVCHGLEPHAGRGTVKIIAERSGSHLCLTVSDDGVGLDKKNHPSPFASKDGHVHALGLLRRRLECLYGKDFRFEFEGCLGKGASVLIQIPFVTLEPEPLPTVPQVALDIPSRVLSREG
jgi:two-component system sensor histidine kinase LytS